jgi:hypothetical protein
LLKERLLLICDIPPYKLVKDQTQSYLFTEFTFNAEASAAQVLEMFLFNNFLGEMELEDLNILGPRFTWYHPNGRSMSRIDRMLISEEWTQVWGESAL